MPEMGLELPSKEQYISSREAFRAEAARRLLGQEEVSASATSALLGLLETIPGVNLNQMDKQAILDGKGLIFEIGEFGDIGLMTDLFKDGDILASAAYTFPILPGSDSTLAFRKFVGEKAAEIRIRIDEGARFKGGSYLTGSKIPFETGMTTEGSIDFSPTGELRRSSGILLIHGLKQISVARAISSLVEHETTNLTPHQLLKNAAI